MDRISIQEPKMVPVYAVESPNKIKSADPATYYADGKLIPLSERFDLESDDITFSLAPKSGLPVSKGFFSQLENVIEIKMDDEVSPLNEPAVTGRSFPAKTIKGKDGKVIKEIPARKEADKPARTIGVVDQVMSLIEDGGVTEEEIKWSGVKQAVERIAAENKGKVPKAELLEYLRDEGATRFEEVKLGGVDRMTAPRSAEKLRQMLSGEGFNPAEASIVVDGTSRFENLYTGRHGGIIDAVAETISDYRLEQNREDSTRYSDEVLPGGENYREMVLSMEGSPSEGLGSPKKIAAEDSSNFNPADREYSRIYYADIDHVLSYLEGEGEIAVMKSGEYHVEIADPPFHPVEIQSKDLEEVESGLWHSLVSEGKSDPFSYTSSHYPNVPNYVAHIRTTDRWASRGKEGTLIEEFQGDRAKARRAAAKEYAKDKFSKAIAELSESQRLEAFAHADTVVPPAPFAKTEPESALAMFKRALRDAVSMGKDWIGWTSGETQADRYDLSKHLSEVRYEQDNTGANDYDLIAYDHKGSKVFNEEYITLERIEELIGKEMAEKISKNEGNEVTDSPYRSWKFFGKLDLKVGGEGMKAFYDKMMPAMVSKYVKQWGAKVVEGGLEQESPGELGYTIEQGEDGLYYLVEPLDRRVGEGFESFDDAMSSFDSSDIPIWKVDITPEMKKGVEAGQPTFSMQKSVAKAVGARAAKSKGTKAEVYQKMLDNLNRLIARVKGKTLREPYSKTSVLRIPSDIAQALVRNEVQGWTDKEGKTHNPTPAQIAQLKIELEATEKPGKFITIRQFMDVDPEGQFESLQALATYDAMLSGLPAEVRAKMGGFVKLASLTTENSRSAFLNDKLPQMEKYLDKFLGDTYRAEITAILKKKVGKKSDAGAITGKGAEMHAELDAIREVINLGRDELLDKEEGLDDQIRAAEDFDLIESLTEEMLRLEIYGNVNAKGKNARSSADLLGARESLEHLIKKGESAWKMIQEQRREEQGKRRDSFINIITGGRGLKTQTEHKKEKPNELAESLRGWIHIKQLNWEWLINAAAREGKVRTLQSPMTKWAGRLVHKATHKENRLNLSGTEELIRFQAKLFGIPTNRPLWRIRVSKALESHIEEVEDTGVKMVAMKPSTKKIDVPVEIAERVVSGEVTPESMGLTDYDAKLLKSLLEENDAKPGNRRKSVFKLEHRIIGEVEEQRLSQDQALNLTMLYRQDGAKENMEYWGYTPEVMEMMEEFLNEQSKAMREWFAAKYEGGHAELNAVYKPLFGHNLSKIKNYSPARYIHAKDTAKDLVFEEAVAGASTTPGFAKQRINHRAQPRMDVGALSLYVEHMRQKSHFIAWAKAVRDLRSAFSHKDTALAIEQYGGRVLRAQIQEEIDKFADGGSRVKAVRELDWMRRQFTVGALTANWGVGLKQLASQGAWMFDMPMLQFAKYESKFFANPEKAWKSIAHTEFMKERWAKGYDRDFRLVVSNMGNKKGRGLMSWAMEEGMITGKLGDAFPIITGGYAMYQWTYDKEMKEHGNAVLAKEEATLQFEMSAERAQQAGGAKDQSHFQSGGSVNRIFSMFLTSPLQYYRNVSESILDLSKQRTPEAFREAGRRWVVGQIILPISFQFITDLVRNVPNMWDDDDETGLLDLNPSDYWRAMALGPLNGLFIVGHGLSYAASTGINAIVDAKNAGLDQELEDLNEVKPADRTPAQNKRIRTLNEGTEKFERVNKWAYTPPHIQMMYDAGEGGADFVEGALSLMKEDRGIDDLGKTLHGLGEAMKIGGGGYMAYDVGHRVARSFGLDEQIGQAFTPNDIKLGDKIKKAKKEVYSLDAVELKELKAIKHDDRNFDQDQRILEIGELRAEEYAERILSLLKPHSNEEIKAALETLPSSTIPKVVQKMAFPDPSIRESLGISEE